MGFPDGWTDVEGVARTKRLMMLGNAVQVQCATVVGYWLAEVAAERNEALAEEGLEAAGRAEC